MATQKKVYFGRPRGQVQDMLDLSIRARSRNLRKIDLTKERAESALSTLSARDREFINNYHKSLSDDYALASFSLALQWLMGEGLSQQDIRRAFKEVWAEEYEVLDKDWTPR